MKTSILLSKFVIFLSLFIFPLFIHAADLCYNSEYTTTLSSSNTSYTNTDSVYWQRRNYNYHTYYINVQTPGTVTISITGGYAGFTYSNYSCPDYTYNYNTSISFHTTSDFNLYVDAMQQQSLTSYTLNITFIPDQVNTTANPDIYTIQPGTTLSDNVLTNDNGNNIYVSTHTNPTNGTLSMQSNGNFTYTPNAGYTGQDNFSYTITDDKGETDTTTVTIYVTSYQETNGQRLFSLRHQDNLFGDVTVIGNTILCLKNAIGNCVEPPLNTANNYVDLQKTPQSYSTLSLPANAKVTYARLYWQGRDTRYNGWNNTNKAAAKVMQIHSENNNTWYPISADTFDHTDSFDSIPTYEASADVTSYVAAQGAGKYYINPSTFFTHTGATTYQNPKDYLGSYGAWVLVVVYQDPSTTEAKNISIFDGYRVIDGANSQEVAVSGFLTPKTGTVNSEAYVFAAEGDRYIEGDNLLMKGVQYNKTYQSIAYNSQNAFDSRVRITASRSPSLINNEGIDIHSYNVGTGNGGKGIITNNETGAKFNFTTGGDVYFPSLIVFSTQLYLPKLCYDYAFSQFDQYKPTDYNSSTGPRLEGDILGGEPIKVKLYFKNLENSDLVASDFVVNIKNIDVTQAQYNTTQDSVQVTYPNSIYKTDIPNSSLSVGPDHIHGINIGAVDSLEYFYIYYSLDTNASRSHLSLPLDGNISYNIYVPATGATIPYTYNFDSDNLSICKEDITFQPEPGIFSVVHNTYYSGSNQYYNIPTQVTSREGNLKVESFDPLNLDNPKIISTMAAVEMIDAGAFHDTQASCQDPDSAISPRVWVLFENSADTPFDKNALINAINTGTTTLSHSYDLFKNARENATFRVSYNYDTNSSSLIGLTDLGANRYNLTNFPSSYAGGTCGTGFTPPTGGTMAIEDYCGSDGSGPQGTGMSPGELTTCMECIYGKSTKFVCSRDNFAIRPEALQLNLYDQNQSSSTTPKQRLTTNPYTTSTDYKASIAAEYKYRLEVNATNHHDNNLSLGYIAAFSDTGENISHFVFAPSTSGKTCNDENNKTMDLQVLNGRVELNASINQVGEYSLELTDTSWTKVDHDTQYMTHHNNASHWLLTSGGAPAADCTLNSDYVVTASGNGLNGCNISSNHTNVDNANLKYHHLNLNVRPYKFSVANTTTLAQGDRDTSKNFIYFNNINTPADENISVHFNSTITALSYGGTKMTNYTTSCYAQPLDLNLSHTSTQNTTLTERYILHDANSSTAGTQTGSFDPSTNTGFVVTTPTTFFANDLNGTLHSRLNVNFDRNQAVVANPEDINFSILEVNASSSPFQADLTTKYADGNATLNQNVKFYYGRTAARKTHIVCSTTPCSSGLNGEPDVLIYYEAYCYGTTSGNTCNKALMPTTVGGQRVQKVDSRWFAVVDHNETTDGGSLISIVEDGASNVVVPAKSNFNNFTLNSRHTYNGNTFPYTATMKSNVPNWLIYDEENPTATQNRHVVIFEGKTDWTGYNESNETTTTEKIRRVNRRVMW